MGLLRSWLIRGLILSVLAAVGVAGWIAHGWVSPEQVRAALVAELSGQFPEADIHVGSASLRIFGGISVTDLRLTRRGESEPFFATPSAVLYHDKEQLNRGRMLIRKVELDSPTVRLTRAADGSWNVAGLARPGAADAPLPTFVVKNAVLFLTDERPDGLPPLAVTGAKLSLLNDPVALLKIEVQGAVTPVQNGQPAGELTVPVSVSARLNRVTNAVQARVEVAELAVGPDLAPALARLHPTLGDYASQFTARVGVRAELDLAEPNRSLRYDVKLDVRDGRFDDPELPWPVEHLSATVRLQDGRVTVEKGTARFGKAAAEFSLETRPLRELTPAGTAGEAAAGAPPPLPADDSLRALEEKLERLELKVRELVVDDDLFVRMPPAARKTATRIREMFSPVGSLDATVTFARAGGGWKRELDLRPNRLGITYELFRYPVTDLTGWVKKVTESDGTNEFRIQLTGSAGGRRVELSGRVGGADTDPLIDLKVAGTDVPVDDRLFNALPEPYAGGLRKLRATARGDFVAEIRQADGENRCENTFRFQVYDGALNYTHFPYPLTRVKGHVLVRITGINPDRPLRPGVPHDPNAIRDRIEVREFEGVHGEGRVWVNGDNEPVPGTADRKLSFRLQGEHLPIDDDLRAAIAELKLDGAVRMFAPRGRLTFGADVEMFDRGEPPAAAVAAVHKPPFDPIRDLRLTINFRGPTVTPAFFPYDLDELAGVLRYAGGKVDLARFTARHGASRFGLDAAEVRFAEDGEVWINLGGLSAKPLVPDAVFVDALPGKLRAGVRELRPAGPMELAVRHMVVHVPPEGGPAPPADPGPAAVPAALLQAASARPAVTHSHFVREAAGPAAGPGKSPDPTVYWNAELRLAGASVEAGQEWRDVHGAIASVGRYEGTHLGAVVGNGWLERATVANQPLTATKLSFRVRPQQADPGRPDGFAPPVVEFPDLTANLYQGVVGGEARVVLDDPVRYRLWLTASGIRLDELATRTRLADGGELRGLAQGRVLIENTPDPRTGVLTTTGAGQIDVPAGRMYNLPVMLPLLKLLKLQAPDQTAFEEAHAVFELKGDRVKVTQLDLIGTAVSLGGSGELSTSGDDVRFEFYTIWSQALKRWLTTPLGDVTSFLSGNLFKIEMVKKNGEMQYRPHMLPAVTEPVKAVAERLRNRLGPPADGPTPTYRATGPR